MGTPLGVAEAGGLLVDRTRPPARPRSVGKDSALRRLLAAGDAVAVMIALTVALVIPGTPAAGRRIL